MGACVARPHSNWTWRYEDSLAGSSAWWAKVIMEPLSRDVSLQSLADTLELISSDEFQRQKPERQVAAADSRLQCLPTNLHPDALDVIANVMHFVADGDVRAQDDAYRDRQMGQMRRLIEALRRGESRAELMRFSFLTDTN
jgi:hypothetical protein